jgi:hypothetical protein
MQQNEQLKERVERERLAHTDFGYQLKAGQAARLNRSP